MKDPPGGGASARRLAWLAGLSLVLHLAYFFGPWPARHFLGMDETVYWDLAAALAHQGRLALSWPAFATVGENRETLFWTPAYPALLALILKTGLSPKLLLGMLQAAMAAGIPVLLFPVARHVLRGRYLWLFLAFAAVYPYYFQLASQTASEIPALFLSLACLSLAMTRFGNTVPGHALLGSLAAWLCLTRPEYLVFSLLLLARLAAGRGWLGSGPRRDRIAALLCAFALWTGAWLYRNYTVTQELVFTTRSGYSLVFQNEYYHAFSSGRIGSEQELMASFPALDTEMERYRYLKGRAWSFIAGHPAWYAQLCGKRLVSLFLPQEAKAWLYRTFGKRKFQSVEIPFWFRMSNAFFLIPLWLLVLPAFFLWLRRARADREFRQSPGALLLLLVLGQGAVYVLFAYVEYQRSIMDMEILMLGAFFLKEARAGAGNAGGRVPAR